MQDLRPEGLQNCTDGYKGRVGIYQVMPVTEAIGRIIMAGGNAIDIADQATKEGVWDLRRAGLEKVKAGPHQPRGNQQRHDRVSTMAQASTAIRSIKTRHRPSPGKAATSKGKKVKGSSRGRRTSRRVRAELRRQGVAATRIRKQSTATKRGGKVNPGDIAIFSRQLATMLAAGIPLVQAFEIVGAGHDKPAMQKLILDIKADVEGGTSLHEALAKHPLYFDDLYVNLVEAGEQAGALEIAARQDRHLQGKDRGDQEEGQEGAVLSGRGAGRRRDRHASSC